MYIYIYINGDYNGVVPKINLEYPQFWNGKKQMWPGDSIWNPNLSPIVGGSLTTCERVMFHHPKKATKDCQISIYGWWQGLINLDQSIIIIEWSFGQKAPLVSCDLVCKLGKIVILQVSSVSSGEVHKKYPQVDHQSTSASTSWFPYRPSSSFRIYCTHIPREVLSEKYPATMKHLFPPTVWSHVAKIMGLGS